jgi:hypothetical protein
VGPACRRRALWPRVPRQGFNLLPQIRALLPTEIELRVAGVGTEELPAVAGVDVSGAVWGEDEDAWFASVRVVLLPYHRAPIGGVEAFAASAVQSQAAAYQTPCVALSWPTMDELAAEGGCDVAATLADVVARAAEIATSEQRAREAWQRLETHRRARSAEKVVADYLQLWDQP